MLKRLLSWLPALVILTITFSLAYYWLNNKPKAKRVNANKVAPLVKVFPAQAIDYPITITAMGSVVPAQKVNLTSRINGMVTSVSPHFMPGEFLKKGEQIIQLDPTDYKLLVQQKENELEKAKFNLTLEQGRQAIAQREFTLLNAPLDKQSKNLVLRKPHLALAKSAIKAAQAALTQARLDLSRTRTVSPFNAIVLETNAQIGSWVSTFSTGTPLIKLAGIDSFWIIASLSINKLSKIAIPSINSNAGSKAIITHSAAWGSQGSREGTVKRLKAELEASGRLAELIIEVKDPLSQQAKNKGAPVLILGSFVRVQITGDTLHNVIALPNSVVHNGIQLWLLSKQNTLEIQTITPIWKGDNQIFIDAKQIPKNARIISSNLSTPVQGMTLRTKVTNHE
ncbi:efflux RND transporter periplasmic adaptor subunit [methanotrophic endosymbiont of Bathymodiolus puteoserpentis (Logatchev)]|jgi:RND family efflux transporter MFP subunit|uniref:efflux RND transporter periplasmic adaptor subunit n=1 Tax=methanotrophic endosymbiont of Bathymodiolus puteoserpentis (Logatchev) TaxID=343235 RepID=UPI0013C9B576|nr:HlyD family efflux transporter periplasmic adaptor subunit [methanotrophic endosymbiont of Bathymodiolus puteoserpentis (Logatchev)]SHE23462.1 Membrane fusion protein of RND family multidrug efflux pump [methanotrophic endosymbiont of Bathymodiolus puteoserpentis (Logatchev)]